MRNHENHIIQYENHENHENPRIPNENNENHENLRISFENQICFEDHIIHRDNYKTTKKSYNSTT